MLVLRTHSKSNTKGKHSEAQCLAVRCKTMDTNELITSKSSQPLKVGLLANQFHSGRKHRYKQLSHHHKKLRRGGEDRNSICREFVIKNLKIMQFNSYRHFKIKIN